MSKSYVFLYASIPHVLTAAQIYLVGSFSIFMGLVFGKRNQKIPKITTCDFKKLPILALVFIALLSFFLDQLLPFSLGIASSFFAAYIPYGIIFLLARFSEKNSDKKIWWLALGLVLIFTINNILFSFLRMEMILPSFAFILGIVSSGHLKIKTFLETRYLLLYVYLIAFAFAFPWMKNNRGKYGAGFQRIEYIQKTSPKKILTDNAKNETILTRLSLLNQLSQVARIADKEGFYWGKTLEYWKYVFIPRIFWPNKPPIATGSWFAFKISTRNTKKEIPYRFPHSWSANMTIPGELYLNFGWLGIVAGGSFLGWLYYSLWSTTHFYEKSITENLWGNVFAFYLIFMTWFQFGPDIQSIINLIGFTLMIFVGAKFHFEFLSRWTKLFAQ